jgi:hypothetical protein
MNKKDTRRFFERPSINPYKEDIDRLRKRYSVPKGIGVGPVAGRKPENPKIVKDTVVTTPTTTTSTTTTTTTATPIHTTTTTTTTSTTTTTTTAAPSYLYPTDLIGKLLSWWVYDTNVTTSSGLVTSWVDKYNSYNLIPGTYSNILSDLGLSPSNGLTAISTHPALPSGLSINRSAGFIPPMETYTIFIVASQLTGGTHSDTNGVLYEFDTDNFVKRYSDHSSIYVSTSGATSSPIPLNDNFVNLIRVEKDTNQSRVAINGVISATFSSSGITNETVFKLFSANANKKVLEVVMFSDYFGDGNGILTSGEITGIESYLSRLL